MAGAVMAVVVAMAHGYLGQALKNIGLLLTHWRVMGIGPVEEITWPGPKALNWPMHFRYFLERF